MKTIIKKTYENRHPLCGRIIHHDSRSRNFEFNTDNLKIGSVIHERHIPILDQGQVGDCVANAAIGNLATTPLFEKLPANDTYTLDEPGAVDLYNDLEIADGFGPFPPNDQGSDGLTAGKVLLKAGLIASYQWVFDPVAALRALSVTPFMLGCDWHEAMMTPANDGRVVPHGPVVGGHEILCRGFDMTPDWGKDGKLWFDNSWGTNWGIAGRFYLTFDDFAHLLKKDGDITVLLPLQVAAMRSRAKRHHHRKHVHHK